MKPLFISATNKTPQIIFDIVSNTFEISGKSLPENVSSFFYPVLDWLESYEKYANPETTLTIKLDYFNTASSKLILDIFLKLEDLHKRGITKVIVEWYFDEDDEDMEEIGEDYADIVEIPFEMKPV